MPPPTNRRGNTPSPPINSPATTAIPIWALPTISGFPGTLSGGDEKQIALFPVFVDDSGKTVRGTFANNRLPGKRTLSEEERRGFYCLINADRVSQVISQKESGVRPVGYEDGSQRRRNDAGRKNTESGLVTYTIRVPRSLSERMASNPVIVPQSPSVTTLPSPAQPGLPNTAATVPTHTGPPRTGTLSPATNRFRVTARSSHPQQVAADCHTRISCVTLSDTQRHRPRRSRHRAARSESAARPESATRPTGIYWR